MRFLTVTTAASDRKLLTTVEMRAAAGLAANDSSQDDILVALEARVAASIMAECNIAIGAGAVPTLMRETLTEVFYSVSVDELMLSRRHEVAITSVVVDLVTLETTEFLVDPESGFLYRLCDDRPMRWCFDKATVVYAAGFTTVPGDLKQAAMDAFKAFYQEIGRDPSVKRQRVDIPGLRNVETDYWVGAIPGQSGEGALPATVSGQLKRFYNAAVG